MVVKVPERASPFVIVKASRLHRHSLPKADATLPPSLCPRPSPAQVRLPVGITGSMVTKVTGVTSYMMSEDDSIVAARLTGDDASFSMDGTGSWTPGESRWWLLAAAAAVVGWLAGWLLLLLLLLLLPTAACLLAAARCLLAAGCSLHCCC